MAVRVELQLRDGTLFIEGVILTVAGKAIPIPRLIVDTGNNFGLMGPSSAVSALPDDKYDVPVHDLDRKLMGTGFDAQLEMGAWRDAIEVIVLDEEDEWLLGLPVLRLFDLLLRPDPDQRRWLEG